MTIVQLQYIIYDLTIQLKLQRNVFYYFKLKGALRVHYVTRDPSFTKLDRAETTTGTKNAISINVFMLCR